jgi:hypothetical protein
MFEMYTTIKPNHLFSKYRGFGPFRPLVLFKYIFEKPLCRGIEIINRYIDGAENGAFTRPCAIRG